MVRTTKDKIDTKRARVAKPEKVRPEPDAPAKPAVPEVLPAPEASGGAMKLKDLIEAVATATGGRKPEVKATIEATLAVLGEALVTGRTLAMPPLGKLRVVKNKGPALTLKLRLAEGARAAGLALADDGEDG